MKGYDAGFGLFTLFPVFHTIVVHWDTVLTYVRNIVLDHTRVAYSYKHQCLVNIIVDGVAGSPLDQSQWHLPTYDPYNQNKYHYRLHSLDIYFWSQTDALQFVNGIRRVLPASQVEVADEPPPPPPVVQHPYSQSPHDINPLVQKLEQVAVSDPAYSSPKPTQPGITNFAPPPAVAAAVAAGGGGSPHQLQQQQTTATANFAPMAYNPAAPAAPEQIQHREKTPPPIEEDGHDPLAAALARDHAPGAPFSPGYPPGAAAPAPPPPHNGGAGGVGIGLASPGYPPTQFGHLQRSATMPVSGLASPGLASPGLPTPGLASPYGTASFPRSPGYHPTPVQSPGLPPPPPGGYAQFNYTTAPSSSSATPTPPAAAAGVGDYGIHQQVYRPTEPEVGAKYRPAAIPASGEAGNGKPSRLGQNAERFEKGVTGMLKRFEKKFG